MGREIEFLETLSPRESDRLRVWAWIEKGIVTSFVVQYEAMIEGRWHPVVRYDTAHGFAHRDLMRPRGAPEKQPIAVADLNSAFTFAIRDVRVLWKQYRAGYEQELSRGA